MGNVTKQASTRFSIVKRSKGQSAVEKASYISRSILVSEFDGQTYRPKYHEDLVHSEITLPPNAPKEYADRAALWNAVELSEKGQKSQLARMLKASLPNEWSYELAEEVVRDYVQRNFVDKGMCADWAIHDSENDKGQRNLHIHVLLTMRPLTENKVEVKMIVSFVHKLTTYSLKIFLLYFTEMWLLIKRCEISLYRIYNFLLQGVKIHICTVEMLSFTYYNL